MRRMFVVAFVASVSEIQNSLKVQSLLQAFLYHIFFVMYNKNWMVKLKLFEYPKAKIFLKYFFFKFLFKMLKLKLIKF